MKRLGKLFARATGAISIGVIALVVFTEINLSVTCYSPTPSCLPRYRAAGHMWSKLRIPFLARIWYARGADAGDPIAMFHLGWTYQMSGWADVVASTGIWRYSLPLPPVFLPFASRAILRKAAEKLVTQLADIKMEPSWPDSVLESLSYWRLGPIGAPSSHFTEAARWYELSAQQGFAPAMNNLGAMYVNAEGLPQDLDKALSLALEAAELGNPVGALNVVVLANHPRTRDDELAQRFSTVAPETASPADLAEPTFERTELFFGSLPPEKRAMIRAAARQQVPVQNSVSPLTPDSRVPTFAERMEKETVRRDATQQRPKSE
jgi:Sel1 repeat